MRAPGTGSCERPVLHFCVEMKGIRAKAFVVRSDDQAARAVDQAWGLDPGHG